MIGGCAMARLSPIAVRGAVVAPLTQKAVLMVVAAFDGQPISYAALAEYCGCSPGTIDRALLALEAQGVISVRRSAGGDPCIYDIEWAVVHRLCDGARPPVRPMAVGSMTGAREPPP